MGVDKKISQLPGQTSVLDGAFFTLVSASGENIKISVADFLNSRTLSGALQQDGPTISTPILDIAGQQYKIRDLVAGSGIKTFVEAENGAEVAHNFQLGDAGGIQVLGSETALSPFIRSIVPGTGIDVTNNGENGILVALSGATPITSKTVTVSQLSDLPTPSAGVITLADDTDYFFINDITTSDRFAVGDSTQIRSTSTVIVTLTYTGTGVMFTGEDINIRIRNIMLVAANAAASFFSVTSSTSAGIGVLFADNVVFVGATFGSISCNIFSLNSCGIVLTVDGITMTSTTADIISIAGINWTQAAGIGLDLGVGIFESIGVNNMFADFSVGTTLLSGLANSGNITAAGKGSIFNVTLEGGGAELINITPDDNLWIFEGNNTIRNTIRDALLSIQGNSTETVIASSGVPVKVAGTFTTGRNSGMTPDTTGRVTYDLLKPEVVPVDATLTFAMPSGGSNDIKAYIAINGSIVADTGIGTTASSSVQGRVVLAWQLELTQNDFVEVFVENNSGTTNIILVDAVLRVK